MPGKSGAKAPDEYRNLTRQPRSTAVGETVAPGEIAQNGLNLDDPHDQALLDEGAFAPVPTAKKETT